MAERTSSQSVIHTNDQLINLANSSTSSSSKKNSLNSLSFMLKGATSQDTKLQDSKQQNNQQIHFECPQQQQQQQQDQVIIDINSQPEEPVLLTEQAPLKYSDDPNLNLEKLCLKLPFERNCLRCDFGKLYNFCINPADIKNTIPNNEISLGVQGDRLRKQMRYRSRVFVVMNIIWLCLVILSYSVSTSWFELKTLDKLSNNILKTAAGCSIAEIVICGILLMFSIHSVVNFSLKALRIYQYGVLAVIILELVVNLLLVNFVPIALIKAFILVIFHSIFLLASKVLYNAMQSFIVNFLPLIYNQHLVNLSNLYNHQKNYESQKIDNLPALSSQPSNSIEEAKSNMVQQQKELLSCKQNIFTNKQQ